MLKTIIGGKMKKWYKCPFCNKNLIKYGKRRNFKKRLFIMQKCGKEIEIKINSKKSL